eukprot:14126509-Alexandrium_andersonii.AAC.1
MTELPPAQLALLPLETLAAARLGTRCTRQLDPVDSNPMTRMKALPLTMSLLLRIRRRAGIAAVPILRDGPHAMVWGAVRDVQPPLVGAPLMLPCHPRQWRKLEAGTRLALQPSRGQR